MKTLLPNAIKSIEISQSMPQEAFTQSSAARFNLLLSLVIIFSAEIISWAGIMPPAHEQWRLAISGYFSGQFGFLSAAAAGFAIIAWQLPITRLHRLLTLTAGAIFGLLLSTYQSPSSSINCLMAGWGTVSLISTLIYLLSTDSDSDENRRIKYYFMDVLAVFLFIMASSFYLKLTATLSHETHDLKMLIWDLLMFGDLPSSYINLHSKSIPGMLDLLRMSYIFLPIFMISIKFMGAGKNMPVNIIGVFLGTAALGYSIYFIAPVCGPIYLLGESFPLNIPTLADATTSTVMPLAWPDFPRNGIPSLHMAWALSLAFIAVYLGAAARLWAGATLLLTFCATLALGEHYVIDLIIALPFSVLMQAVFTQVPAHNISRRRRVIAITAVSTAVSITVALTPGFSLLFSANFWWAFWIMVMAISIAAFWSLRNAATSGLSCR